MSSSRRSSRDYIAAALILHPDAQRAVSTAVNENNLTGPHHTERRTGGSWPGWRSNATATLLGGMRVFEMAMEEAMTNGGFIVDLASGAEGSPCERRISSARSSKASSPPTAATSSSNSPRPPTSVGESAQSDSPTARPSDPFSGTPTVDSPSEPRTPRHLAQHAPQRFTAGTPRHDRDARRTRRLRLAVSAPDDRSAAPQSSYYHRSRPTTVSLRCCSTPDSIPPASRSTSPMPSHCERNPDDRPGCRDREAITFAVTVGENALDVTMSVTPLVPGGCVAWCPPGN